MRLRRVFSLLLIVLGVVLIVLVAAGSAGTASSRGKQPATPAEAAGKSRPLAIATFAGGCFWCMEHPFDELEGVVSTTSGYTGGHQADPSYQQVSAGGTGHAESVEVRFDPSKIGYARLLEVFWHNIDPTVVNRQFCDHGSQYRTAIFYHDEEQKKLAEASRQALLDAHAVKRIVTEIVPAGRFYPAEDYHQDFYKKNPIRYKTYRLGCGRDRRLRALWGDAAGH